MSLFAKSIFTDEPAEGWLPWGALAPILALLLFTLPLISINALLLQPLGFVDQNFDPVGPIGMALFLFISFGFAGSLFLAWVKYIERRPFSSIGFIPQNAFQTFMRGYAVGTGLMLLIIVSTWGLGGYEAGATFPAFNSPIALLQITLLLIGFALQSSVEEFVFRGWLLSVLTRKFNIITAVIVSSVLFTFMHFNPANPWVDNISIFLFSIFACAWVLKTGNIWGVMGWHAGWNWITATGFEVPVTGLTTDTPALLVQLTPVGSNFLTGGDQGPEGSIMCIVVLAVATLFWILKPRSKELAVN